MKVRGAKGDYECTRCHDTHNLVAASRIAGYHVGVIETAVSIPCHDMEHQGVSCVACHDGAGLEVGPMEGSDNWTTYVPWGYTIFISEGETKEETGKVAFVSHNIVIEASCERCLLVEILGDYRMM